MREPESEFDEISRDARSLLAAVAVHLRYPEAGGLFESQKIAIQEWYDRYKDALCGTKTGK